jgi:oligoendopeptidase F
MRLAAHVDSFLERSIPHSVSVHKTGASPLQVWRNSLGDQEGATDAYRRALALGATRPLPELFRAAGAELTFDQGTIGELVALVEAELDKLRA